MTDQLQAQNAIPPTFDHVKQKMEDTFMLAWRDFTNRILSIPGMDILKQRALGHFDDGFLAFREAIRALVLQPLPVNPPAPAPAPEPAQDAPESAAVADCCETETAPA